MDQLGVRQALSNLLESVKFYHLDPEDPYFDDMLEEAMHEAELALDWAWEVKKVANLMIADVILLLAS